MAKRVFFSFHYERDIWRASIVRNSWVVRNEREDAGFWDASLWEEAKRKGEESIRRMILKGLENTSVSAVLIGAETVTREWVIFEIIESFNRGNGLLGIFIDGIKDRTGRTDVRGLNPLSHVQTTRNGQTVLLSSIFRTYDWVTEDGYRNLASWVESSKARL
jgi:hypothetical protein